MKQNYTNYNELIYIKHKLQKYYNKLESKSDNKDIYERKIKYYTKLLEGGGPTIIQNGNEITYRDYKLYRDDKYNKNIKDRNKGLVNVDLVGTQIQAKDINNIKSLTINGIRYYDISNNVLSIYISNVKLIEDSEIPYCINNVPDTNFHITKTCYVNNYIKIYKIEYSRFWKEIRIVYKIFKDKDKYVTMDTLKLYSFINKFNIQNLITKQDINDSNTIFKGLIKSESQKPLQPRPPRGLPVTAVAVAWGQPELDATA